MSNSTINNKPSIHIEDEKCAEEEAKGEGYTGKVAVIDILYILDRYTGYTG